MNANGGHSTTLSHSRLVNGVSIFHLLNSYSKTCTYINRIHY